MPTGVAIGFALALTISAAGFYRVVYFISTGYAFSIVAIALAAATLHTAALTPLAVAHVALLVAYGLRLGVFLLLRQRRASYRREYEETDRRARGVPRAAAVAIWVSVSALYVLMSYPLLVYLDALADGRPESALTLVGVLIMAGGLVLETVADRQKSRYKAAHPGRFCDVGLYRLVRCPNYLGESIFWIGQFVAGLAYYGHWSHWAASAVGLASIELIMVHSAWRLEVAQEQRYGHREDYRRFTREVPILWPLPLYSLRRQGSR